MIRIATVGTSKITESFLEALALEPRFKYTASYSRSSERAAEFAEKHGAELSFSSLGELASSKSIDAVYIASPNALHSEQCRIMLKGGKHIICEKPIATSLEEYSSLHKLAEKSGLVYMEAMMNINVDWYSKVSEALREIGRIALARLCFCQRSSRYDSFMAGEPQNIFDMSLHAGTLMDLGIYCVYAAAALFGVPKSITACATLFDNDADRSGAAIFEYDSFPAVLSYSKAGQAAAPSEIIGDCGVLQIGSISQFTDITLIKNGESRVIAPAVPRSQVMLGEIKRFAELIEQPAANEDIATRLHLSAQAAHSCMDKIKQSAGLYYPQYGNR